MYRTSSSSSTLAGLTASGTAVLDLRDILVLFAGVSSVNDKNIFVYTRKKNKGIESAPARSIPLPSSSHVDGTPVLLRPQFLSARPTASCAFRAKKVQEPET